MCMCMIIAYYSQSIDQPGKVASTILFVVN